MASQRILIHPESSIAGKPWIMTAAESNAAEPMPMLMTVTTIG